MKKPNLYIETSVFGFCFDQEPQNLEKQKTTTLLFDQIRRNFFEGFISDVVLRELQETTDLELRQKVRGLASSLQILDLQHHADVEYLSKLFVDRGAIPANKIDDALHVAIVATHPMLDILVSWNCRHIVNVNAKRKLKGLIEESGYKFSFELATPQEVIRYDI